MRDVMADLPYFFGDDKRQPGKRIAWVMAICVHLLLAAFLIYGIRWQSSAPDTVSVELVSQMPTPTTVKPPTPVPPPEPKPEQKQEEPVREEPPPPPKADILRKEPEKPKVAKPPVEKPAPQKEKPKEPPKEKPRFDPIAKMLERESQRLEQSKMAAAVASTLASLKPNANASASASNKGLADYLAKIRGKIRGNIVLPQSIAGNPESTFEVTQLPSGEVLSVKLRTSSGNSALDAAVERAILKSSPLPKPDNPSLFSRELEIKYRPLEE